MELTRDPQKTGTGMAGGLSQVSWDPRKGRVPWTKAMDPPVQAEGYWLGKYMTH